MRVVAFDPYLPEGSAPGFVELVEFVTLLALSDVVTLHVPLVEGTANLIGREQISKMKDGAYLVNCARGGIVDETALEEALQSGKLAAAALDVFEEEPTPGDHPLWTLENILVTRTWRPLQEKPFAEWPSTLPRRSSVAQGVKSLGGRSNRRARKVRVNGGGAPLSTHIIERKEPPMTNQVKEKLQNGEKV